MVPNRRRLAAGLALIAGVLASGVAGGFTNRPAMAETIRIGVTAGPHAEIMEVVKKVAAEDGLTLKITEFTDYIQPNAALAQGDLDANSYQHQPFLDNQVRDRGYKIVSIAKTVVFPMGIYSKKIKKLADLRTGAQVAIPNDPTNGGRALLLLAKTGLITVDPKAGIAVTLADIVDNPKKLKIIELDAAQLPRSLEDVDAGAVNTNFALTSGLQPTRDAIAMEGAQSPYMNVLAVQTKDKDAPWVAKLVKAYHSEPVKAFVEQKYTGAVATSW